ncbi:MAG: polysaccharide deacetylase family protein [Erysipelotrichaceae bacterium]|nr:polysaccharide deacetylase family protein [Erysipelotrichaceae bacterium]
MKKINRKRLFKVLIVAAILFICIIGGMAIYIKNSISITFVSSPTVQINSELDPYAYIDELKNCEKEDINIDSSNVNIGELGTYTIIYTIKDKDYKLNIEVVDDNPPTLSLKDVNIDYGDDVTVDDFIDIVADDTEVKKYFKEDYDFTQEGDQEITIVAEDTSGNITEVTANLNVFKDIEAPTITGLKDITVYVNETVNYMSGLSAVDNHDISPIITVNSDAVDTSKIGTYSVTYTVTDKAGNKNTYTQKVTVKEKSIEKKQKPDGNKVVYLTFDDGPSANTKKILEVLDKYDAKATFFVTGNGQKYNNYIKDAHDAGHTIGLHTYTHQYSIYTSQETYFEDLTKIGNMVKDIIGYVPKYIRFPGGSSNVISAKYCEGIMSELVDAVREKGYEYYDWNVDSGDASGNNVAVSKLVKNSTSSSANSIVILMHDTDAKDTTVEALPKIIEYYQDKGYVFKGIDDSSYTAHHSVKN